MSEPLASRQPVERRVSGAKEAKLQCGRDEAVVGVRRVASTATGFKADLRYRADWSCLPIPPIVAIFTLTSA